MRVALAFVATLSLASAQGGVPWFAGTWEEAMKAAADRNVPILVAFIQDDEEANERIIDQFYGDKDFIEMCMRTVPVMANISSHKPVEGPGGRTVCSKFGHVACSEHRNIEMAVRPLYFPDGTVVTPTHIVARPDGTEISRLIDVHSLNAYQGMVRGATSDLGKGLGLKEYEAVKSALAKARSFLERDRLALARAAVDEGMALAAAGPLRESLDGVLATLDGMGEGLQARVQGLLESDQALEAGAVLRDAAQALRGRPAEARVREAMQAFRSSAAGKAVAAVLDREDRLRAQFDRLLAGGEAPGRLAGTVKAYYDILSQVPGTRLAAEVRERIQALGEGAVDAIKRQMREEEANLLWKEASALRRTDAEKADDLLRRLVAEFPGTTAARRAERLLGGS